MLKNLKKLSLIIFAVFLAFIPLISLAQSKPVQFTPQIEIPNSLLQGQVVSIDGEGKVVSDLLPRYVKAIYNYGLMIGGVLAAIVLMAGGVVWLTSGGDSGSVSKAKGLIFSSITGLFILFGSYLILNTINPELVKMKGIQMVVPSNIGLELICNDSLGEVKVVIEKKDGKETYINRASNEAINGKICTETQACYRKTSNDSFACMEKALFTCCEYAGPNRGWCLSVIGTCPNEQVYELSIDYTETLKLKNKYEKTMCTIKDGVKSLSNSCLYRGDGSDW